MKGTECGEERERGRKTTNDRKNTINSIGNFKLHMFQHLLSITRHCIFFRWLTEGHTHARSHTVLPSTISTTTIGAWKNDAAAIIANILIYSDSREKKTRKNRVRKKPLIEREPASNLKSTAGIRSIHFRIGAADQGVCWNPCKR